jgi:hypothetical protein
MLSVKNEMVQVLALAYQNTLETLILDVDQNAYKIQIVIDQKHVSTINAKTRVQEYVELMQNVEFRIMDLFVFA